MKILVAIPKGVVRDSFIPDEQAKRLEAMGEVEWNETERNWTEDELIQKIGGVDVYMTGWGSPGLTARVLEKADRLKVMVHTGGSVSGYATAACYDRGISVISGNELYARSVAESVVAYSLYLLRDIGRYNADMLEKGWKPESYWNEGLLDQKVGLIGFGAVARYAAKLLRAFGAELYINADHVTEEEAASYGAKKASLDEILSACKIISVHLAKTPETYHLIDAKKLSLISDGAVFINTARGPIIDEAALAEELAKKRFKAALDVYEIEPLPMDSPLRTLDNVLLMPHVAGPTVDRRPFVTRALLDELPKALAGDDTWLSVTRDMMSRMTQDKK